MAESVSFAVDCVDEYPIEYSCECECDAYACELCGEVSDDDGCCGECVVEDFHK